MYANTLSYAMAAIGLNKIVSTYHRLSHLNIFSYVLERLTVLLNDIDAQITYDKCNKRNRIKYQRYAV